jgi:hypothetical protein
MRTKQSPAWAARVVVTVWPPTVRSRMTSTFSWIAAIVSPFRVALEGLLDGAYGRALASTPAYLRPSKA